jgi:hypothetical protein
MDTPRTNAVAKLSGYSWGNDVSIYSNLCMELERELAAEKEKVRELREALEKVLPSLAHEYKCGTVKPAMHWAEHGSMSFENCQCQIKEARAILEKTK